MIALTKYGAILKTIEARRDTIKCVRRSFEETNEYPNMVALYNNIEAEYQILLTEIDKVLQAIDE